MAYYAAQSPRGFANETNTYRFATKAARDKWVAEHESDGDCNSASQGASAITADQARKNVAYKGDAATKSYNSGYIDFATEAVHINEQSFFAAEKIAGTIQGAVLGNPSAAVRVLGPLESIRIGCGK